MQSEETVRNGILVTEELAVQHSLPENSADRTPACAAPNTALRLVHLLLCQRLCSARATVSHAEAGDQGGVLSDACRWQLALEV